MAELSNKLFLFFFNIVDNVTYYENIYLSTCSTNLKSRDDFISLKFESFIMTATNLVKMDVGLHKMIT